MISIRDIYQWKDKRLGEPQPPQNPALTPLQLIEWQEQNAKELYSFRHKSFVGEILMPSPARITNIQKNQIIARAEYEGDYYHNLRDAHEPRLETILTVIYEIFFDESLYETVKLIHDNSTVEVEGEITDFKVEIKTTGMDYWERHDRYYLIKLKLSEIRVIYSQSLSAELLDDEFIPKNAPVSNASKCFIATAAFGNQDITEVVRLREFRDNVLRNSISGRCFIRIYSFLSPPVASIIRRNNWLRKVTRSFLRKFVLPLVRGENEIEE